METDFGSPFTIILRFTMFGLNFRFVARIEWLRLWPNCGPLLQIEHLAMWNPLRWRFATVAYPPALAGAAQSGEPPAHRA